MSISQEQLARFDITRRGSDAPHRTCLRYHGRCSSHGASVRAGPQNHAPWDQHQFKGHGRYNQFLLITCCLLGHANSIEMFGFGIIITAASCDLKLGVAEMGILASATFSGLLFTCPLGYLSDLYGRRKVLLISMSGSCILSAISCLSPSWQVMMAFRVISCCFSAGAVNITLYLGEWTTSKHRTRYMFILNSFQLASQLVTYVLAYFVLTLDFNIPITLLTITFRPWRLLTLLMSLPLRIGSLMLYFLYESPKFLDHIGKKEEALKVLTSVYKINRNGPKYPVKYLAASPNDKDFSMGFWRTFINQSGLIFKRPLLWRTLQLFYVVSVCCTTSFVFLMWFPEMANSFFISFSDENSTLSQGFCKRIVNNIDNDFKNTTAAECNDNVSTSTIYSGMIYGLFFMTLNLTVAVSFARYRKSVIIVTFLISAVSAVLVDVINHPIVNIIAFTLLQSTSICIGVIFCYYIDLYPTSSRSFGSSLGVTVSRLSSFAGTNIVGAVIVNHCNLTFYCWSAFVLTGVGVAIFLPSDKQMKK